MRVYSKTELDEIVERHRDDERGMHVIGLCIAALSGASVTLFAFWLYGYWK